jgi:DNA processing protein
MGTPHWTKRPSLGVVGSRKMSSLTKEWMDQELLPFLNRNDVSVISGGARGVDQAAHLCALRAKKPTFVFLPSGLSEIYPRDMVEWKNQILNTGGAFLSEYWPNEKIKKHYFIERNRLIAAMSDFVLIAQGEKKSGTLLTAQWALDLGRDIGVLPGHPMDFHFSGNLHLMRSGVPPVVDSLDLENMMMSYSSLR